MNPILREREIKRFKRDYLYISGQIGMLETLEDEIIKKRKKFEKTRTFIINKINELKNEK